MDIFNRKLHMQVDNNGLASSTAKAPASDVPARTRLSEVSSAICEVVIILGTPISINSSLYEYKDGRIRLEGAPDGTQARAWLYSGTDRKGTSPYHTAVFDADASYVDGTMVATSWDGSGYELARYEAPIFREGQWVAYLENELVPQARKEQKRRQRDDASMRAARIAAENARIEAERKRRLAPIDDSALFS